MTNELPIQKALISVNINCKCGIILEHDGDIIHSEIEHFTIWLADLFNFDTPGFGIWIFEALPIIKYINDTEYEVVWENIIWRDLNEIEWESLQKRERLWNYQPSNDEQ